MKRQAGSIVAAVLLFATMMVAAPKKQNQKPGPADGTTSTNRGMGSAAGEPVQDDPTARRKWELREYGDPRLYAEHRLRDAERQRELYPLQVPHALGEAFPAGPSSTPAWTSLGPTSANFETNGVTLNVVDSGRLSDILPDPSNDNNVYILAAGGGMWKTTNFLSNPPTWVPLTDSLPTTAAGAAAFGSTTSTIYLGLGDPFDTSFLAGGAMVKSTNGGNTWSAPFKLNSNFVGSNVRDVKVDFGQGTGGADVVLVATDVGLFRSIDGGNSYTAIQANSGQLFFQSGVWTIVQTSAGWLASAENFTTLSGSFAISTDHGATWNPITNGGGVIAGIGRVTLAVGAPGDSVVYAFAANTGDGAQLDLFRSSDGGQNWTALGLGSKTPSNPNADQTDMNVMHGQAFYNQMVLVDPTDASRNTVYLGGNLSSVKSTDGGKTWTVISNWLPGGDDPSTSGLPYVHADFHTQAFTNIGSTKTLFFGTDGGLFVSTDGGATWSDKKNIGLVTHLHYSLTSSPSTSDSTITGLQDNGTRVRVGTSSVFNQTQGGDGFGVATGQANALVTLADFTNDQITSSDDLGVDPTHWVFFANGGINTGDTGFVTEMTEPRATADSTGKVFFTTGLHDVYETTNGAAGAAGWSSIGNTTSSIPAGGTLIRNAAHVVGVSPVDTNHIGVGLKGGELALTANGGANWTVVALNSAVSGYSSFNANVAWVNNSVLYVCSDNPNPNSPPLVRVVKSIDGGTTWAAANTGLPDEPVSRLVVDVNDATGNTLYAATFIGVYQTTDGGANWHLFGSGLPAIQVTDMYMPPDGSFLRISTYGRGIWEIPLGIATHFSVTAPATAAAGAPFSVTVTALDAGNNRVTSYTGTVHFTLLNPDAGATTPADYTFTAADGGSHIFNNGFTLVALGSQQIKATDTVTATLTGTSSAITVGPGPATRFSVTPAAGTQSAGAPFNVTVTALDRFGNTATGYTGTVHFTSSDAQVSSGSGLPADSTLTSGVGMFTVTLKTAGSQSITATDTVTASITGSGTVTVNPAAAQTLAVSAPPTGSVGFAFNITVTAKDAFGNTATGYPGTVKITKSAGTATVTLPPNSALSNGVGSFSITPTGAGTLTLTATDTVTGSITGSSGNINVVNDLPLTAGPPRHLRLFRGLQPVIVATFTDADTGENGSSLTATINWGDGTTTPNGTIVRVAGSSPNTFQVLGSHAYARKGQFTVTVTVTDSAGPQLILTTTIRFLPRESSF